MTLFIMQYFGSNGWVILFQILRKQTEGYVVMYFCSMVGEAMYFRFSQ